MKTTTIYILIFTFLSIGATAQPPAPDPADLAKLDFWVGEWDLTWEGGKGTNRIEKTLNGRVIQEHFEATEGGFAGYLGTSISTFNPRDGQWHQAWADSNGGYINLVGIMDGDQRIFRTVEERTLPGGKPGVQQMRFYDITEDGFTWDWEWSDDGGETWNLSWRIYYTRSQ